MTLKSLLSARSILVLLIICAFVVGVACGGAEEAEEDAPATVAPESGSGPAPTAAPGATQAAQAEATPTPVRAATPTPTPRAEATPTPIATVVVTFAGIGVQGGHARFLTTEYPELWDPHLMGTIVGLEGGSPLYN